MLNKYLISSIIWCVVWLFGLQSSLSPAGAFTIGEERQLGEKLLYSVRSYFELIDDPDLTRYLTELGNDVLEVAGIQYFDYHFFIINSKEFNAFAAPSGLLFFNSGLIGAMNSEDELLSVIAHEVGHIVKRHLASRVEKSKYSTIASLGLALAAIAFGGSVTPVLFTGALAAGQSVDLHFSRKNEEEADLLAYGWMKELHRHPEGQAKMLETMRRIARYRSEMPPQYLTTHPNPEARLDYIESLIQIDNEAISENTKNSDDFGFLRFKYRILAKAKDPQTLRAYFSSTIASDRSSELMKIMAQYGLSQIAMNENDYQQSIALLEKVIAQLPDKPILKTDKGVSLFGAADFIGAKAALTEALNLDSSDMYATFYMAKLLYKQQQYEEAKQYLLRVSYHQPEYSKVYFELGQIASDQKQFDVSNFYLGKFYFFEGRFGLAVANLTKALASTSLPERMQAECKGLLKKMKMLKK